jgi:hydrogenase maturation protein HypF
MFLLHDRDIETRCDDSVVSVVRGRGVVVRRSRGYVPRAIRVAGSFDRPVLACGALLKNTFCLAAGESAWLGPHIGDLENLATFESYTSAIEKLGHFLQVRPEVVAYDMHPDYLSSAYARERPETWKIPVQHHHAHIVSAMAEHHLEGPVIGIAYDGTGYGTDGTSWGGEVLVATAARFRRLATFRALPLLGGDRAIREPWRIAVALALDAYGGDVPREVWGLMESVSGGQVEALTSLRQSRLPVPLARGVGRYFDGFGALFLDRPHASFEGQVALEWNQAADPDVTEAYPFEIHAVGDLCELDMRPTFRAAAEARIGGAAVGVVAAAFHNTLALATSALVRRAAQQVGRLTVVASGGCFQNARLAEGVCRELSDFDVRLHEQVPPGDGGIALGQALVADAVARERV